MRVREHHAPGNNTNEFKNTAIGTKQKRNSLLDVFILCATEMFFLFKIMICCSTFVMFFFTNCEIWILIVLQWEEKALTVGGLGFSVLFTLMKSF